MPILKSIVGHGASVRATVAYLTRDGRAVACDFLHCVEVDERGGPVWRQIDDARRLIGTDSPVGGRPVRTWQHFVVRPAPNYGRNARVAELRHPVSQARVWYDWHVGGLS